MPATIPGARPSLRLVAGWCALLAVGVGVVATVAVAARGSLEMVTVTSVRGETYEMVVDGIYASNAAPYVAEGIGWDLVTLFLVVPALLAASWWVARGSLRARLVACGLLAYLAYQYLMYAMSWAADEKLFAHVAIYAISLVGLGLVVATIPATELRPAVSADRFPHRAVVGLASFVAVLLPAMWVPRILAVAGGELEGNLHGQTTLVVDAMDLGLVVPLAVVTAVLVHRRATLGYLLASIVLVKAVAMGSAITAMVLARWWVDGDLQVAPLVLFVAITVVAAAISARASRSIGTGLVPAVAVDDRREAMDSVSRPARR